MLIRIGAYIKGTDPELDEAIEKKEAMQEFISQGSNDYAPFETTVKDLIALMS
ncbi:Flagellum-specific ATP synthase FliI [hydrothermal vent metagenome]|uniref:Flagellum-specific ATP synthase FliI n=1 Tax=hydrothermal vent metagenome TaxID=652676 RepID=A0A1W1CXN0_9ZZZZ